MFQSLESPKDDWQSSRRIHLDIRWVLDANRIQTASVLCCWSVFLTVFRQDHTNIIKNNQTNMFCVYVFVGLRYVYIPWKAGALRWLHSGISLSQRNQCNEHLAMFDSYVMREHMWCTEVNIKPHLTAMCCENTCDVQIWIPQNAGSQTKPACIWSKT